MNTLVDTLRQVHQGAGRLKCKVIRMYATFGKGFFGLLLCCRLFFSWNLFLKKRFR